MIATTATTDQATGTGTIGITETRHLVTTTTIGKTEGEIDMAGNGSMSEEGAVQVDAKIVDQEATIDQTIRDAS